MAEWSRVWHQAMAQSFLDGRAFGANKTVVFSVKSPVAGNGLRIRFSNLFGSAPYRIGELVVRVGGRSAFVTMGGRGSFEVPTGGFSCSDPLEMAVGAGESIEIRMYYPEVIIDANMIEEEATLLKGNHAHDDERAMRRPLLAKVLGAYNAIPTIQAVEVLCETPAKAIVAFGDSITALSRWTKPLAARLEATYPGEYALLNSGISGNCLLYEPGGIFGPVYGQMGTSRFERDVLDVPGLDTVIFGLGVNDVSYYTEKTKDQINLEAFGAAVRAMVGRLHERGVRVVAQTITPRLGCAAYLGRFTQEMEAQRLQLNDWLRSADIFDYLFDADAVVREERADGYYYREGLHQGDHLHPNAAGGMMLADAFDLAKLTGKDQA